MKLAFISTHPPRECGLATFNNSLINAIGSNFNKDRRDFKNIVVALNAEPAENYDYPDEVKFVIRQQSIADYGAAADFINSQYVDACILQHEFGIYGGDDGIFILSLVNQLEKPLISIFHTVLERPSYQQKVILQTIAKNSDKVIVMGKIAINLLNKVYDIPLQKICHLEHGAPDLEAHEDNPVKEDPLFRNKKVLLTFGLISRNKGLETVIRALPEIVSRNPDALYVVLGNTHPGILKHSGEEYRNYLLALAEKLNVAANIAFINRFVAENELINYLSAADVYISPYLNEAQITSGTLAYAIGAGSAVVATPYWHARELLAQGRGRLFNFKDEVGLANTVNELLGDTATTEEIRRRAYQHGLGLRWPVVGRKYLEIINNVIENPGLGERIMRRINDPEIMPDFSLSYVRHLTDDTGIIQHARYGIPNWKEGYCVDDNARALIMSLMAAQLGYKDSAKLMPTYMSFLLFMQNDDGNFRNFLSYGKQFLDEVGSEDAFGRTVWALGYLINYAPNCTYSKFGEELFRTAMPNFTKLAHLRGVANTVIGISYYLKAFPTDNGSIRILTELTKVLTDAYRHASTEDWQWFEDHLTYDNAILPLALFHSAAVTREEEPLTIAYESMRFLENATMGKQCFNPVGNDGWYCRDGLIPPYDQQGIDVMAMVLMYAQVYQMTRDTQYLKKLFAVYSWFLGENSLSIPLYDPETNGCYDGLRSNGVSLNQGAESTLAYLIAHLAVLQVFKTVPANAAKQQVDGILA